MTTPMRSSLRRTAAASTVLLLALALTACGGDDASDADASPSARASETTDAPTVDPTTDVPEPPTDEPTDGPADVPTADELRTTLVTAADLPDGFIEDPTAGDEDEEGDNPFEGTCLADVGQFSDAIGYEPDAKAETEFDNGDGSSAVNSQVQAYLDQAAVTTAFAEFTDTLQQCTSAMVTTPDGISYDLQVAYDDTVDLPGADDQLSFELTGTVSVGADTLDVDYRFVVGLLGPYISILGTFAVGDDVYGVLDSTSDLAVLQAERVADLG